MLAPCKKSYDKHRQHIKKQRCPFANKGPSSQNYGFSSWTIKKAETEDLMFSNCDAGQDFSESLGQQADQTINPKGNQPWIFITRTDAAAEVPVLWTPDGKSWLTGKDSDAGEDWAQEEKGVTDDKMVGWHHWLNEQECKQTQGYGEGQGSLGCCTPWDCRVGHDWVTEQQQQYSV